MRAACISTYAHVCVSECVGVCACRPSLLILYREVERV